MARRVNWFIARHYLKAGRGKALLSLITWIALGGITLGVGALITVISVMSGMQGELRGKILESTPHLYVLQYNTSLRLENYEDVGYWKEVLETQLIPQGNNFTPSDSRAVGGPSRWRNVDRRRRHAAPSGTP